MLHHRLMVQLVETYRAVPRWHAMTFLAPVWRFDGAPPHLIWNNSTTSAADTMLHHMMDGGLIVIISNYNSKIKNFDKSQSYISRSSLFVHVLVKSHMTAQMRGVSSAADIPSRHHSIHIYMSNSMWRNAKGHYIDISTPLVPSLFGRLLIQFKFYIAIVGGSFE